MRAALKTVGGLVAGLWVGLHPLVQTLIVLMGLDVLTGLVAAIVTQKLSSDVSFRGMGKKALMLIVVGSAGVMQRTWQTDVPIAAIAAGFYCVHELVSILENTIRAGVPVPDVVVQAVDRMKTGTQAKVPPADDRGLAEGDPAELDRMRAASRSTPSAKPDAGGPSPE
jgi:toxin secretion/phage lysis holin